MGWSVGYDEHWHRDIGYGVPAICDHPDCSEPIDRGLSFVCGGEPYGGERGCGLFFCAKHRRGHPEQLCERCAPRRRKPFEPKPDTAEWTEHKRTHPTWAEWRRENGIDEVKL